MKKVLWADMTDDDDPPAPEPNVRVTKHGVKVTYVPPHLRPPLKTQTLLNNK